MLKYGRSVSNLKTFLQDNFLKTIRIQKLFVTLFGVQKLKAHFFLTYFLRKPVQFRVFDVMGSRNMQGARSLNNKERVCVKEAEQNTFKKIAIKEIGQKVILYCMRNTYGNKIAHFHTIATDLQCIWGNVSPDLPELEVDIGLGYEEPEVWKAPDAGVNPL